MRIDEGRIEQVLKNLLENALRYTPRGGKIEPGAGSVPEDLPYVFDRFYRADQARGSSAGKVGLGLAICEALVTAQGGTIRAESGGKDQGSMLRMAFEAG